MIRRIQHIARRELLEQWRQPVMLGVIFTLLLAVSLLCVAAVAALQLVISEPPALLGDHPEAALTQLVGAVIRLQSFLVFSQFLGISAVLCGHAILHDRQLGTLTFLLLAPVRRGELLLGKVLGAMGWAWLMYTAAGLLGGLLMVAIPLAQPHAHQLPSSLGWWVTFGLASPLWALWVGTVCALISHVSRDVRAAQQGVWFVVFFATLGCGTWLTTTLPLGVGIQLLSAGLAASGLGATLGIGALVLGREQRR